MTVATLRLGRLAVSLPHLSRNTPGGIFHHRRRIPEAIRKHVRDAFQDELEMALAAEGHERGTPLPGPVRNHLPPVEAKARMLYAGIAQPTPFRMFAGERFDHENPRTEASGQG